MISCDNKIVIITGCSSGIGLATTLLFLSQNAQVFGIDISPFNQELDVAQKASFTFHKTDLCRPGAAEEAIAACIARYGPNIDVLANVAGVMDGFGSADTVKDSEWERVLTINLTVPVRMMAAVLPSMKDQKSGAIINVGSYASLSGAVAGVAYTASKHGLVGATKNVAWRFRKDGIRCNAVLPGAVPTNIRSSVVKEDVDQAAMEIYNPVQMLCQGLKRDDLPYGSVSPDDVAQGIAFLASDAAKTISGIMMPIDNAWSTI
ncbi:3-hydroxybutyrate dehydrogenase type 2 [Alternaria rosae]|uniref:3-hydroxybutyrate dehydrogenase type 2 n=1 Tax=Alternaria rosae TaxID=1187941 RepID=UPI001E8E89B2|nr:3-hydroxybutyrate dehydrogenase type 2 [Alternaria rosae]KAH6868500.1 3-hydroxybutyrate dehydrogenase type 2 [Alternaria rosae]